jgi:hypothetical protein
MLKNDKIKFEPQTMDDIRSEFDRLSPESRARKLDSWRNNSRTHPDTLKVLEEYYDVNSKRDPSFFSFSGFVKKGQTAVSSAPRYSEGRSKFVNGMWQSDVTGNWMNRTGWGKDDYAAERALTCIPSIRHEAYVSAIMANDSVPDHKKAAFLRVEEQMRHQRVEVSELKAAYHKRKDLEYKRDTGLITEEEFSKRLASVPRYKDGKVRDERTGFWLNRKGWTKADYESERILATVPDANRGHYVASMIRDASTPEELARARSLVKVNTAIHDTGQGVSYKKAAYQKANNASWSDPLGSRYSAGRSAPAFSAPSSHSEFVVQVVEASTGQVVSQTPVDPVPAPKPKPKSKSKKSKAEGV